MGELILAAPVAGLASKNRIVADDVAMLREEVFRDGVVTRGEAEALFALDASCGDKCPEWAGFFIEAVVDYIVHQEKPQGYVSEENAQWLIRAIGRDGVVDSAVELEMLVRVLEAATSSPQTLEIYALDQVRIAVLDGSGPLVDGRSLQPGMVGAAEAGLIRRILYAVGGPGNIAITRAEAEILVDINQRSVAERNHPLWNELFVKAIASFVMAASGYQAPPREVALSHDAFFDLAEPNVAGFLSRMVSGGARGVLDAWGTETDPEHDLRVRNDRAAEAMAAAETIDATEAGWLAERIGNGRQLHANERTLLAFLKSVSPSIHPDLQPLLDRVA